MASRLAILLLAVFSSGAVVAQRGTAPNGYYPNGYSGDIFRGKVVASDDSKESITLLFEKGNKQQSFDGHFEQPCAIPTNNGKPVRPSDLMVGTDMTAYFVTDKDETTGKKQNVIIGITLHTFNGSEIPEKSKLFIGCVGKRPLTFKVYKGQFDQ
jgi:hypothetical protein